MNTVLTSGRIFLVFFLLAIPWWVSLAHAVTPITPFGLHTQVPKIPCTVSAFRELLSLHNGAVAQVSAAALRGKTNCHSLPINDFHLCLLMASPLLLSESVWNNWNNANMLD
jgi:hypothetical protein